MLPSCAFQKAGARAPPKLFQGGLSSFSVIPGTMQRILDVRGGSRCSFLPSRYAQLVCASKLPWSQWQHAVKIQTISKNHALGESGSAGVPGRHWSQTHQARSPSRLAWATCGLRAAWRLPSSDLAVHNTASSHFASSAPGPPPQPSSAAQPSSKCGGEEPCMGQKAGQRRSLTAGPRLCQGKGHPNPTNGTRSCQARYGKFLMVLVLIAMAPD